MKKTYIKFLSFICALIMVMIPLISCTSNSSNDKETDAPSNLHTVKFNSNGGTPIADVEVRDGQKAAEPTPPTRDNHIFLYWENNGRRWIFPTKEVTEDITLSALWISADDLFKTEPADNPNEILISGFKVQKSIHNLVIPQTISGKTVIGFTDNAFERIHEEHAEHLTLPSTAYLIGEKSFSNITKVHLNFLGKISSLSVSSFENCDNLETVKLAEGLTEIPYRCFFDASALVTIDIPEGVTTIDEDAFSSCKAMRTIVLPSSLTTVEHSAFMDSSALAVVFFKGTPEQFEEIEISDKNDELLEAKRYYYSESQPTSSGDFWHYDKNNTPVLW